MSRVGADVGEESVKSSRKVEPSLALDGVQQLLAARCLVGIVRQLEHVDARAGRGQARGIVAGLADGKHGVELAESQQRRLGRAGDKLEERLAHGLVKSFQHVPKVLHREVLVVIAAQHRMLAQVVNVHRIVAARDEDGELLVVEVAQPARIDNVRKPGEEGIALVLDLRREPVVRDAVDVLYAVQLLVQTVDRPEVVQEGLLAQHLGQKEAGELGVHQDTLVERLANHTAQEAVPFQLIARGGVGVRVRIELLCIGRLPQAAIGVERFAHQRGEELLEQPTTVDARFIVAELVDKHNLERLLDLCTQRSERGEAVLRHMTASDLDRPASLPTIGKDAVLDRVDLDELTEDLRADIEGDHKGDIVQDAQSRREESQIERSEMAAASVSASA
ncbi:hypothetical protein L1887_49726 [Cichorium endivia]|nr:hypothetical protein L1887_49726 [Cichorium endivia]